MSFYADGLERMCDAQLLDRRAPTLVVAGGSFDRDELLRCGFTDVTISNLDERMVEAEFAPFRWSYQNAESMTFAAGDFDQVIAHLGLHHCRSPHQALNEMYRVAKKRVVVFESRDSVLLRLAMRLGLVAEYEVEAVVGNGGKYGGVVNSEIPNYVYRWTEREVEKTVRSFDPTGPMPVQFFYGLELPLQRLAMHRSSLLRLAGIAAALPAKLISTALPRQCNRFAFVIGKPAEPWPWLHTTCGGAVVFNREWAHGKFGGERAH